MFYWLYEITQDSPGFFRLFGSPVFRAIAALTTALFICFLLYPWLIRRLQQRQIGQVVREDGPESHYKKRGTPTMGGTLLIISMVVSCLLWCDLSNPFIWLTLGITVCYTVIGFLDDYWKLRDRSSGGMPEKMKLVSQLLTVGVFMWVFFTFFAGDLNYSTELHFPFVKPETFTLYLPPWLYAVFASLVIFATSTAANLTDGLDGLAIGPVIVSAITFGVLAYLTGASLFGESLAEWLLLPEIAGVDELAVLCAAMAGAGIGFLWYNTYPALVFMGDVGALPLGGALGAIAVFTKHEILSVIIHGIFVVEFLSVIIQRYSFKMTGKRVFAMAPIHHHFEKKGWPETRVTVRFWIISIILALFALASLKVR
ncbi:MAG: phospho-N-acetylmuramoyl-pentapeptide-transferase [Myxococcota bacterium]|jgi:phospho-N-acetylmuramoyl-pentapeptide-transferase